MGLDFIRIYGASVSGTASGNTDGFPVDYLHVSGGMDLLLYSGGMVLGYSGSNTEHMTITSGGNISSANFKGSWSGNSITEDYLTYTLSGASDFVDQKGAGLFSGQCLTYGANLKNPHWQPVSQPITYSISNIELSANQSIDIGRFKCPAGENCYVWQAVACGSGGVGISGLKVEFLAGASAGSESSKYSTSSGTMESGYPLCSSASADYVRIRFMYSGAGASGYQYGTAMVNLQVY